MDDGRVGGGCVGLVHGRAPYPGSAPTASLSRPRVRALLVLVLLLGVAGPAAEAAGPQRLSVKGPARRFDVKVAGATATFAFSTAAGCRYRLTVEPGTLRRPVLEIGRPDEAAFTTVDAGSGGAPAVHTWHAERDALLEARVKGFSAMTGNGRIRLEALAPDGTVLDRPRRFLDVTGELARVGELLVGEPNLWELVVQEGRAYEVAPTSGSAGRVRLRVLDWSDEVIADSEKSGVSWLARPPLRFHVPARPAPADGGGAPGAPKGKGKDKGKGAPAEAPSMRLEVRGLFDGGGTYGLHLRELGEAEDVETPDIAPPQEVTRGEVEGEPFAFEAGPGDLAMIYVPHAPEINQMVQVKRGDRWVRLEDIGRGTSARSPEDALTAWFQPWYPGTYRFLSVPTRPPTEPRLFLMDRASLGGAPIHMGTGSDPTARARLGKTWRLVALGVVMPGKDYLFVCVHAPDAGVAMRVATSDGKVLRTRSASASTISPGLGPSLRFKVKQPGIYRLEARSARPRIVRPLLRRASN